MKPEWFPDWAGEPCVIVGSGPTASTINLEAARGKAKFIAINESWRLAPWADVLYGCDYSWWKLNDGLPDFEGLRIAGEERAARDFGIHGIRLRKGDDRPVFDDLGAIGWGYNSGFHSLNLAVQFGCSTIILVGFDMTVQHGLHWHGRHKSGLNNPRADMLMACRRAFEKAAPVLRLRGITVLNTSPISALECFPKMSLERALGSDCSQNA